MRTKVWVFLLPVVPWVLVGVPPVAGWLWDDPVLGFFLAVCLLIPTVIAFLVLGMVGAVCAWWCHRSTWQRRYRVALALSVLNVGYGVVQLVWILSLM